MGWFEQLPQILLARAFPIVVGLLVSLAIGVIAVWVYGYLLAGTYGVLSVGEAQAPPIQPIHPDRQLSWRQFVAFEWSAFHAAGLARAWKYFWMIHLFITLGLLLVLFWALLILGAVTAFQGYGGFAAFGIGCGGALPLFFLGVILSFWSQLAMIEASREGITVLGAARAGFELLGKRLGAVLLLFLFQIAIGMVLGAVFLPMAVLSQLAASDSPMMMLTLRFPLSFIQWLASSAMQLIFMAAYLALAHDRSPFAAVFPGSRRTVQGIESQGLDRREGFEGAAASAASAAAPLYVVGAFDRVADEPAPDFAAPGDDEPVAPVAGGSLESPVPTDSSDGADSTAFDSFDSSPPSDPGSSSGE